ncbi:MAG: hypothetical protein LBC68_11275 [Prevotellaceae bacterium]|jgi:hypothetical protein|nr:hypothetical protein [Prevotellaceae bacterium]
MQEVRIYIPTKGRSKKQLTAALLDKAGLNYYRVVEPTEAHLYDGDKIIRPLPEQSIAYVRNLILDDAIKSNVDWLIMIDDDIRSFGTTKNQRCVKTNASIINDFIKGLEKLPRNIIVATIRYRQNAWSETKDYNIDALCEVFVAINVKNLPTNIRYNADIFPDDRDFLLQVLISGKHSICFNRYWFACPKIGSNKGGFYDIYKSGKVLPMVEKLSQKWGDLVILQRRKDNTINVKINRKKIKELLK